MKAYVEVFNKENIEILAKNLEDKKYEIYSSGDSLEYLKEKNIKAIEAKEGNFDLVVINFYPFEKYLNVDVEIETIIENIEIEKFNILKKAIKNYQNTIIITDINNYQIDLDEITEEKQQQLALKALTLLSKTNYAINQKMTKLFKQEEQNKIFYLNKIQNLKHGENSHQKAALYAINNEISWEKLCGLELTYNDILDSSLALEIIAEFFDVQATVITKEGNPASVALAKDLLNAWDRAIDSDPIAPMNGVVAFSTTVEYDLARCIAQMPIRVILAPNYTNEAIEILSKNKNLKAIKINTPLKDILKLNNEEIKITTFGTLVQEKNVKDLDISTFKVVTKKKPEQQQVEDMIFAFKIVKHAKSNAIVVAKDLRTIGICAGQTNNIDATGFALQNVCDSPKDSVIAADTCFSAIENIQIAAQNRVSAIIQPCGDVKDKQIIETADKLGLSMISTGISHLKH